MTTKPVIRVSNVSKVFRIRPQEISLRHELIQVVRQRWFSRNHRQTNERLLYALHDIDFSVNEGESLAVIGRNGAGKSTLLRVLARIMRPTTGHVELSGRYVALIGTGAGFIDTMSGRKNIYLNAAIYGIKPDIIESKVDAIIEFADIGQYIDMPIKHYSSGMRSRLGFSIAIHILPDIVFLDEVLAVGDSAFRQKSHNRLLEMLKDNRTVVLVSHSEDGVREVCQRAIWLHKGEMMLDDQVNIVLKEYNDFTKHQNN